MAYKIGEWSQIKDDFRNCFDVSFGPFYDLSNYFTDYPPNTFVNDQWKCFEFPSEFKALLESMVSFDIEPKTKRIEDHLYPGFHIIKPGSFPFFIEMMKAMHSPPPEPDIYNSLWFHNPKIQGLSINHLFIDDFINQDYEQTEQNNSSSTSGCCDPEQDTKENTY